jgi:hypothetical protein
VILVSNCDAHWTTHSEPQPNAGKKLAVVGFDRHSPAAAVAPLPTDKLLVDV